MLLIYEGILTPTHVPALLPLLRGGERAQEGGRVRDRERDRATDVRRRGGAHGVGDRAAPVVADEVDLAAEAIDQGEGVGGEGVEVVGTDDRRGGVAAQPWRDDAVGFAEVLEERDGGRRVIGEAVEEEERARVDRAADERVNLAERQRERGAGQPLMRCVHKSDQLQVEPVGHGYNERHPHSSRGTRWRIALEGRQASKPCQRQCLRSAHKPWIPRTLNA